MSKIWTDKENEILRCGYEQYKSSKEISKLLSGRSVAAIDLHIRSLGLNKLHKRSKLKDLTGMMFGNWKVLERIDDYISPSGYHQTQYLCECQCNAKTIRPQLATHLTRYKTLSCGCFKGENIAKSKMRQNTYDLSGNMELDSFTMGVNSILT